MSLKPKPLYVILAGLVFARLNCLKDESNMVWAAKYKERAEALVKEHMPSGSGFDSGTKFNWDASTPDKLVFDTSFHHMDENGSYDGWSDHQIIIRPSLVFGYDLRVTGRDRNQIKDYIAETFGFCVAREVAES